MTVHDGLWRPSNMTVSVGGSIMRTQTYSWSAASHLIPACNKAADAPAWRAR